MNATRLLAKIAVWYRQCRCSLLDSEGVCIFRADHPGRIIRLPEGEGALHEVWWQKSDLRKYTYAYRIAHQEPMNLVLVTNQQNENMTRAMNRENMLYLLSHYGYWRVDGWVSGLPARDHKTARMCLAREWLDGSA